MEISKAFSDPRHFIFTNYNWPVLSSLNRLLVVDVLAILGTGGMR